MTTKAMNGKRLGWACGLLPGCLLFMAVLRCEAQNLVPNWNFEELEGDCDSMLCCFNVGSRPLHWYSWQNSPDYFNACVPGTWLDSLMGVPQNGWTYQDAWDGGAYVGFVVSNGIAGDYREYVGTELLEPLVIGCTYQLRFRTSPAYGGNYWLQDGGTACDNVGMLFTTTSNAWYGITGPPFPYRNFAHLRTTVAVVDTVDWLLVEGAFIADSAYTCVVLGNFFHDSLTTAIPIGNPDPWTGISYYVVDGVEVVPLGTDCHGAGVPDVVGDAPVVRIGTDRVLVDWPSRLFHAEVLDLAGRSVLRDAGGHWGSAILPLPVSQGMYALRITAGSRSFFRKFVMW